MYECVGVLSRWNQYSLTSSPWLASEFVSPKKRSFRIGSRPFQSASARQTSCRSSLTPAMPSSPER
jgi:hypothetical protein